MAQGNINQAELAKVYVTTQINDSSVIALPTGEAITDARCRALKFDEDGNIVLAGAGDKPFGVGIITNSTDIPQGGFVDIQWKNIGLVYAGGQFAKGTPLAVDANGCFVEATGDAVAVALEAAGGAGVYVKALLAMGNGYASQESE